MPLTTPQLEKLDRIFYRAILSLASLVVIMILIGITNREYYDLLRNPILVTSTISLIITGVGYKINRMYLEQSE